ncbi:hypothetical protein G6N73_07735 [Mesorhizobium camelthorni]|uniref:Uncharacterized protein n=1 Tax=Allomesorhizobium camelthorni TaxID=475069 RepID=A0A6G4W8H9_9HYPH|nr:hypothetical protein [Mesorhizobium camelthorni]
MSGRPSLQILRLLFVVAAIGFGVDEGQACAICFSGTVITPGQKLDSADEAVLAVPLADRSGFRVIEIVKGEVPANEAIAESAVSLDVPKLATFLDGGSAVTKLSTTGHGKPLLLFRNRMSETWTGIGVIGEQYAGWLRQLAATKHDGDGLPVKLWPSKVMGWSPLTDAQWQERARIVLPYLDADELLAAEIAYGELQRTPYRIMRGLKPQLEAAKIRFWIDDPKQLSRLPVHTLLLGIAGDENDAAELEKRIDQALLAQDTANLSAMLAADLELRGPSRLSWLHATFFADRRRTLPEIDAALLALSVQGEADAAVPRGQVIEAYRSFIRARKPMAGFVAMELANWEAWDATADYVDIIRSNVVKDPAGQFAILSYLKSSPLTAGQAALLPAAE